MAQKKKGTAPEATIEIHGVKETQKRLLMLGRRAMNPTPAWPKVLDVLLKAEKQQFDTRGHGDWKRLSPATIEIKRAKHQDTRILRATNVLYRSLTQRRARGSEREFNRSGMRFGTDAPYARLASSRGAKRRLIDVDRKTIKQISDVLQRHLMSTGNRAD